MNGVHMMNWPLAAAPDGQARTGKSWQVRWEFFSSSHLPQPFLKFEQIEIKWIRISPSEILDMHHDYQ
jgi:hypothetical protein